MTWTTIELGGVFCPTGNKGLPCNTKLGAKVGAVGMVR